MWTKLAVSSLWRVCGSALLVAGTSAGAWAAGYQSGHHALELFDDNAMRNAPQILSLWLMFMTASFAAGLLFVRRHVIARWAVGGFVLTILCVMFILPALGLPALSGLLALIHLIFWSPALYLLLRHRPFLAGLSPFSIWSGVMALVIAISFVFDIRDAAIYLDHMAGTAFLS